MIIKTIWIFLIFALLFFKHRWKQSPLNTLRFWSKASSCYESLTFIMIPFASKFWNTSFCLVLLGTSMCVVSETVKGKMHVSAQMAEL